MKIPTMFVDRNGIKVTINTCDFDPETMTEWGKDSPKVKAPKAKAPKAKAAPEPAKTPEPAPPIPDAQA